MSPLPPRTRRLLIAGVVVIALGLVLSTVARRALRPAALRSIAESQLSQVFGRPVTVGSIDVDLLPRLQVTGGDITMGGGGTGSAPSMQLRTVRIVPRLSSVLSGRLAIDLIEIEGLSLAIRRDAAGNWLLPFASAATPASAPAAGSNDKPTGRPAPVTTTAEPEAPPATAVPAVEVAAVRLTNGRVTLVDDVLRSPTGSSEVAVISDVSARVTIQGGAVHLDQLTANLGASALTGSGRADGQGARAALTWMTIHPADLPTVFGLAGVAPVPGLSVEGDRPLDVELTITPGGAIAARGTVRAGRLALDTLQIETVEAPFSFDGRVFAADPLVFHAYGGLAKGRFGATIGPPASWSYAGRLDSIDLNAFLSANTSARDRLSGTGQLVVDIRANIGAAPIEQSLAGTASVRVSRGTIHDFALLAAINGTLGLSGGSGKDTSFDELSATLMLGAGRANTSDLALRMGELRVEAAGWLGLSDQRLDLAGSVLISPTKSAQLTSTAGELRNLRNDRGEIEIPLTATGTVDVPVFEVQLSRLFETAAKYQLKRQLQRRLGDLLRKRK